MKISAGLALAASFAIAGCVGDIDSYPSDGDLPPKLSEAALANNRQTAFNYFVSQGLTEVQSAGIVGNLIQESSVSPTAVEYGGGPGRGIAQWSVGGRWDTSHGDNVTSFASSRGESRWTLTTQLDFIWYELDTVGGYGLSQLRAATTVSAATIAFETHFELCGACSQSARIADAQRVLADYGGSGGGGGSGSGSGSGSGGSGGGASCYSATLGQTVPENTCVQSQFDSAWYQCSNGSWVDRWSDPDPCNGTYPL
jgi:hypothetical protein